MYVVTVEFDVAPDHAAEFESAIRENARDSRRFEPGCRQFDVCVVPDDAARIFLYEVYVDEQAFLAHCQSEHFRRFDAKTVDWVRRKRVQIYRRLP
jgi:autoinducer 2-degrading protein